MLKVSRLQYAKQHRDKPQNFWNKVIWSDETTIELFGHNHKRYIWREVNKAYDERDTIPTVKHRVLECGLKRNYAEVLVKVVDCPDLTLEPFRFPVKGLCGKSRIVDVGGVPYLVPTARLDKIYNMNTVAKKIDLPGAYLLGAGASSHNSVGMNAEMIFSIKAESATSPAVNCNYMASVNPTDNGCLLEKCKEKYSDYDFGLLSNLYASEGKPGKVIEVKVKRRTGKENFVSCMRKSLKAQYGDKSVGMGGSFIIQEGKAKLHIMPREFSACPLNTDEDVDRWLNFYDMKAPLICQSVFVSHDPNWCRTAADFSAAELHCDLQYNVNQCEKKKAVRMVQKNLRRNAADFKEVHITSFLQFCSVSAADFSAPCAQLFFHIDLHCTAQKLYRNCAETA
ncbi:unnamed protein product [Ranitomeya imitator]|uniref:DUF1907 domain-containing protein n=1 Tax=Ranitomeya imitator TaxID=111125 RepID=A0ABN9MBP5_9NEOB|nr:unnamed protein product [Ranitomeya imitator]